MTKGWTFYQCISTWLILFTILEYQLLNKIQTYSGIIASHSINLATKLNGKHCCLQAYVVRMVHEIDFG